MTVKKDDWVEIDYEGSLENGVLFDTSKGNSPLKFKVGLGMVIKGLDNEIIGMSQGSEKTITVKCEDGYGPKNTKEAQIPKSSFQDLSQLIEGKEVVMMTNMGPLLIEVLKIEEEMIRAILNHPLSGKTLIFKVKLNKILNKDEAKALEEEMFSAHNHDGCSCGSCDSCEGEDCDDDCSCDSCNNEDKE
ncbi:MAG: peptidylprolyl isomerase [archaeon]